MENYSTRSSWVKRFWRKRKSDLFSLRRKRILNFRRKRCVPYTILASEDLAEDVLAPWNMCSLYERRHDRYDDGQYATNTPSSRCPAIEALLPFRRYTNKRKYFDLSCTAGRRADAPNVFIIWVTDFLSTRHKPAVIAKVIEVLIESQNYRIVLLPRSYVYVYASTITRIFFIFFFRLYRGDCGP